MNPLIITIIIALGTFILAIFSALHLNQQTMKLYIDAKFHGLEGTLNARFDTLDNRIDDLEARVDRIERQFDQFFKLSPR